MSNPISKDASQYNRRSFLKTAPSPCGLDRRRLRFAQAKTETLAMAGGEKTITLPKDQFAALTKWPRYGDAEKQALCGCSTTTIL